MHVVSRREAAELFANYTTWGEQQIRRPSGGSSDGGSNGNGGGGGASSRRLKLAERAQRAERAEEAAEQVWRQHGGRHPRWRFRTLHSAVALQTFQINNW